MLIFSRFSKTKKPKVRIFSVLLFSLAIVLVFAYSNKYVISALILLLTVSLLLKAKNNTYMLILFGIIGYVNFSLVFGDILAISTTLGYETFVWQNEVRNSTYWLIGAKSLVIMLSTINVFVDLIKPEHTHACSIPVKDNPIIFYGGYFLLWLIFLFFSYSSSAGTSYESNTNTLYEYCLVIAPIVWLYSNNSKKKKLLISVFIISYCFKSLLHGDRSSMIPMALFLFFIWFAKLKLKLWHILVLSIVGIFVSNLISVYRVNSALSFSGLIEAYKAKYFNTLFVSDTVSQSYYTSVVTQMTANDIGSGARYFGDFLLGLILGGSFGNANVYEIVLLHYTHRYGGFFYSWPYFWFGYIGVFIFSFILGFILLKVFNSKNSYGFILKMIIVIFAFRWYLYSCFDLFRGVIFVSSLFYFVTFVFDELLCKGTKINNKYNLFKTNGCTR